MFAEVNWLTVFFIILLTLLLHEFTKIYFFRRVGVACASTWPIFGALPTLKRNGILATDSIGIRKHGKVYGTYLGITPTLVVADAEMLKEIFTRQFHNFPDRMHALYISKWWENAVVIAKGNHWKYLRQLLCRTICSRKLKKMHLVLKICLDNFVVNLNGKLLKKTVETIDMREVFSSLTMEIILKTSFGVDFDSIKKDDTEFVKHAKIVSTLNIGSNYINALPLVIPRARRVLEYFNVDYVNKVSLSCIKNVIKSIISQRKVSGKQTIEDTLQLLMNAHTENVNSCKHDEKVKNTKESLDFYKNRGLTDDELIANSITVLMAGYDTTATTVTWMAYLLATHQHIQDKLISVIDTKIGTDEPTYEKIIEMEYLDMFLSETLRLYPAANRTGRNSVADTSVCGYHIPKGLSITVPIYAMHRLPEYWKNPEEFIPERFSKTNRRNINPYIYMPFGAGPRSCIGVKMAQLVCKMVIVTLLQHFRLNVTDDQEMPPLIENSILTKPINGMKLKVKRRESL